MSAVAMRSFGFGEQLVRVIDRAGAAWFVANDVCGALEIGNARDATARLEEDERDCVGIADAIGRERETTIVSESGVYALIFTSRKAAAKQFRRWVTQEVLPTLRQTGRYEMVPVEAPTPGFDVPDEYDTLLKRLALAREARVVFGIKAARVAWRELGLLPALTDDLRDDRTEMISAARLAMPVHPSLSDWMEERVDVVPGHREPTQTLFFDYVDWCTATGVDRNQVLTLTAFGRGLTNIGVQGIKTNRRHRVGLRLKAG